jgi:hypothetical protein
VSHLPNVCVVLITPNSSEIRWVNAVPELGERMHSRFGDGWIVVDEVFQSGAATFTVFAHDLRGRTPAARNVDLGGVSEHHGARWRIVHPAT